MEAQSYYYSWEKRCFDLSLALVLLIILMPLFLLLSLIVLVTAGWPIFYRQKRAGLNKKSFKIIKFRTMYVGAQKNQWRYRKDSLAPSPMYKNWHDPRFVGIGKWLSKTGLDELPQLLNIIRGEMSFVGPRPLPINEAKRLGDNWDFRYQVKPGIFSEWSVKTNLHHSLQKWEKLEADTLKKGGFKYEVGTILRTLTELIK